MEFSRQEYWTGFPFPSPGDLPNPGIEPPSPVLQVDSLLSEPAGTSPYTPSSSLLEFVSLSDCCVCTSLPLIQPPILHPIPFRSDFRNNEFRLYLQSPPAHSLQLHLVTDLPPAWADCFSQSLLTFLSDSSRFQVRPKVGSLLFPRVSLRTLPSSYLNK